MQTDIEINNLNEEEIEESFVGVLGGARPGSGRPPGSLNKKTLEMKEARDEYKQKVFAVADRLFLTQFNTAIGNSYLIKLEFEEDEEGKRQVSSPKIVEDPHEIMEYLVHVNNDAQLNTEDQVELNEAYYFITTKKPDMKALEDLLNRGFGRPTQEIDVKSGGKALQGNQINFIDASGGVIKIDSQEDDEKDIIEIEHDGDD